MASSGSFYSSGWKDSGDNVRLKFEWSIQSQSIENNSTVISWKLTGARNTDKYVKAGAFKVTIAGETVFSTKESDRIKLYNGTTIASDTYTLEHNDDGTKSFTVSIEGAIYSYAVNCTGSETFTLDMIARASQPSCITYPNNTQNVGSFGDTISIHMNRKSSAFTHTVRYAFGSLSGTCTDADTGKAATAITTGFKWKIPESFMDLLPASLSGSGTIYVDTYKGSTKVGTKYCGFTATVPASVKPSCTFTLDDITSNDVVYGSPVKGLSKIKVTVTPKLAYSSPIASTVISANGVTYYSSPATTGVLLNSGVSRVTVTVTDKRGRSGSAYYDMNVQDYSAPSITDLSVHRCDEDGTLNSRGEFAKVSFSAVAFSMSGKNSITYQLKYKKTTATSFTTVSLSDLLNNFAVDNYTYIFAADGSSAYDVSLTATDRSKTSVRSTTVSTAFTLMNFDESGQAVGFGGVPEKDGLLHNYLNIRQQGNSYAFQPGAFNGEKGYTLMAVISLYELNVNAPIVFVLNRRGATCPMKVYIRFASSSTSTDPDLDSITYEGDNYGAFLVKQAESTWKLYVDNTSGWSNPCVQDWFTTDNQMSRMSVEFPNEQVATLPNPYYRATPVVSRSILDAFYPVGYILLLYSHANPNTMYPGTTWVRIYGAFPWFTDANGEIGLTGGERTVTLTEKQIPSHNHGGTYTNAGTARTHAWITSNGSAMGYDTVNAGGGEAHNNMPPYIQISAWRRTA